ncbi:MAG: 4Fe-4S binding protein [Deltaproteobacteria bacterium]|jgi:NADH-quinone oxidoreductase subunit I|nr:4Fe-4S binding protein [Deltaproteobacteria bacterium]
MLKAIWDNIKGLYSLLVGMSITGRYLLSPVETIHFPRQVVDDEIMASFRGPIQLTLGKKDPTQTRCISCQMCAKACPGHCLTVTKGDAKAPIQWLYDFSYCCLCGACVETCPTGALEFSHKVYLVTVSRQELILDLLSDLKTRGTQLGNQIVPPVPPAAKEASPSVAPASPSAPATLAAPTSAPPAPETKTDPPKAAEIKPDAAKPAQTKEPAPASGSTDPVAASPAVNSATNNPATNNPATNIANDVKTGAPAQSEPKAQTVAPQELAPATKPETKANPVANKKIHDHSSRPAKKRGHK